MADIDKNVLDQMVTATVWYGDAGWEARLELPTEAVATETAAATETAVATEATAAQLSAEVSEPQTDTTYQQPLESCVSTDTTTGQVGVSVVLTHTDSPAEFYVQWSEELDTINNLHALLQVHLVISFKKNLFEVVVVLGASARICGFGKPYRRNDLRGPLLGRRGMVPGANIGRRRGHHNGALHRLRKYRCGRQRVYRGQDLAAGTACYRTARLQMQPQGPVHRRFWWRVEQRLHYAIRGTIFVTQLPAEPRSSCFQELTNVDALTVEILHKDEKSTYVNLRAGACNVGETLVSENLAAALELETQSSCTGYICNINSPSEFWIQLENSVADLEWIAEQLSDAHKFADLDDLTPGMFYTCFLMHSLLFLCHLPI